MVSLSHKMARIFFSLHLPFANLLCSQILMNATMMFVMLMLTVPTLMVYIIASARKDTLEIYSLANVDWNSDTLCRAKHLSITRIVFITGLMIKRQRNGFHGPTSYFY